MSFVLRNPEAFYLLLSNEGNTVRSFANKANVNHATISRLLNKRSGVSSKIAKKISETLNAEINDIFVREIKTISRANSISLRKKDDNMKTQIIAFANAKGGIGKTTSATTIANILATRNYKVLLIDLDSQGNSTLGLGCGNDINHEPTIVNLMTKNNINATDAIVQTSINNLDLIPSSNELYSSEIASAFTGLTFQESRLYLALKPIISNYDFIIFDCHPFDPKDVVLKNILLASNNIIIPTEKSMFALQGIAKLSDLIIEMSNIRQTFLHESPLNVLGVLAVKTDARLITDKSLDPIIRRYFKNEVFNTSIPNNTDIGKAQVECETVYQYAPHSRGSVAYKHVTDEILERLNMPLHA